MNLKHQSFPLFKYSVFPQFNLTTSSYKFNIISVLKLSAKVLLIYRFDEPGFIQNSKGFFWSLDGVRS